MNTFRFKTNINCGACVKAVTPDMNAAGIESWQVDTDNPDKVLTARATDAQTIQQAVEAAGFSAELLPADS